MGSIDVNSSSIFESGLNGFQAAHESLTRSYTSGNNGGDHSATLHESAAALMSGTLQANASAEVIKSVKGQDEIIDSIIDIFV